MILKSSFAKDFFVEIVVARGRLLSMTEVKGVCKKDYFGRFESQSRRAPYAISI